MSSSFFNNSNVGLSRNWTTWRTEYSDSCTDPTSKFELIVRVPELEHDWKWKNGDALNLLYGLDHAKAHVHAENRMVPAFLGRSGDTIITISENLDSQLVVFLERENICSVLDLRGYSWPQIPVMRDRERGMESMKPRDRFYRSQELWIDSGRAEASLIHLHVNLNRSLGLAPGARRVTHGK